MNSFLEQRIGRFTASEIYKLFVEPKTKADKEAGNWSETAKGYIKSKAIEQKYGYRENIVNKAMEHGIITEAEAFEKFKSITGQDWSIVSKQFFEISEISGASPDGVLYDGLDIISVCDIKCPQPGTFFDLNIDYREGKEIETKYFYQLQMQMLATKCDSAFLCYYLAEQFVDTYTNAIDHDFSHIPLEDRMIILSCQKDQKVHDQILAKIEKAEELKQQYISML